MHNTPEAATVKPPQQNSTSPILPEGYLLRDYSIIKMLGHGGFGITYLAQEDITDKLVVIKENYPTTVSFRDMASLTVGPLTDKHKETYDWALTRFLDEAKTLSRLSHPNIVPILAAFKALGTAYYVMPHVEGTDLHKAAPAPDNITAEWFLPVLEKILSALDYLHSKGLIHRDIKPNNILLRADGEPILIDFGTARALESTHSHSHIGTPGYMPLEQLSAGGKRGPWTDFYALGATCYRLITGEIPPSSTERAYEDEYLPLTVRPSLAKRFPEHVLSSIDKALRMNRHERWQSAQEWLAALKTQQSVASAPIQTAPQTPPTPVKQVQPETIPPTLTREQAQEELKRLGISSDTYNDNLLSAAEKGEAHILTLLITAGANVNGADDYGNTPLIWAAYNGYTECVRLLLVTPGIDVNKGDEDGNTPLSIAAENGHTECVRLLLSAPQINVNRVNDNTLGAPLSIAAYNGHTECVRLLLAAPGIDVNERTPLLWAAENGHTECVRLLLVTPGIDVNKGDEDGNTPLYRAAIHGHTECVRLLFNAPGINTDSYSPLSLAAMSNNLPQINQLLANGAAPNQQDKNTYTPLHYAASGGLTKCMRALLSSPNIDVNKADQNGETPLYRAAIHGHTECVRLLLDAPGINVNQANKYGRPPLWCAAIHGHTECVRLLLDAPGIDVNKANDEGRTPLGLAASKGDAECVRLLLAAPGIDVNQANQHGDTPLYWAAILGHTECVRLLLAAPGIDVNKANNVGTTPLSAATGKGHTECARLIRAAGETVHSSLTSEQAQEELKRLGIYSWEYDKTLRSAAEKGEAHILTLLIAAGADVNVADDFGRTPLIFAADKGHTECVRLLLAAPGININQTNQRGDTPLLEAAENGHTECVRLLLAAPGININQSSHYAYTPLYLAAHNGHTECVRLLLAAPGIDVNKANWYGNTPLYLAAYNGHTECVRLLLAAPGININQTNQYGYTPLHWAACNGHKECVRLLLAAPGIDINKASSNGETPLLWAAENGHTECVRLLLAAPGIDINKASSNGTTPLSAATDKGHTECARLIRAAGETVHSSLTREQAQEELKRLGISSDTYNYNLLSAAKKGEAHILTLLLAAGADVNVADDYGWTPLFLAAYNGQTVCVRLLLAAPGIDVNQAGLYGDTPLILAADKGHTECVRLLLAAPGIDVNIARSGSTPLFWAAYNGHTECVRLLLAAPGININQANQYGETPLLWAAINGHTECVRLLLAAPGININQANQYGKTPLSAATGKGHTECARLIRAAGETVHSSLTSEQAQEELKRLGISSDTYNDNLLSAAKKGEAHILTLLITAGADVNVADDFGRTPLYWAAYNGQTECVRLLLAAPGIDVNKPDKNGWTPLIGAANMGHTECVRLLLAAPRIDVNKANHDGKTPLYYAEKYNHNECARLIRASGGKKPSWWKSLF